MQQHSFNAGDRVRATRDLPGMFPISAGDEGIITRHGAVSGTDLFLWGVKFDRHAPTTHHFVVVDKRSRQSTTVLEYVELVSTPVARTISMKLEQFYNEDERAHGYYKGHRITRIRAGYSGTVYDGVWGAWLEEYEDFTKIESWETVEVVYPIGVQPRLLLQPIRHEDCINALIVNGLLYQTNSGDIALAEAGRFVADNMIRSNTETHIGYLRALRNSHPDAAKMAILLGAVKNAAAEGGSLEAVNAKLAVLRGVA